MAGKKRDVDRDSFYWKFLEFGTNKMAARPFLRPAFEANKEGAIEAIGKSLDETIQAAAREGS
jgi:HK97 gp10 family phage protein